jgi:RNA polymerase sigma-70 factor (ECF subfamily)
MSVFVGELIGQDSAWLRCLQWFAQLAEQEGVVDAPDPAPLVDRLRNGDQDAWDELVTDLSPRLFNHLRHSLPTEQDAEDALNETFLAAVRSIQSYDGGSSLTTWLFAIARFKIADFFRRSKATEEIPETMHADDATMSLEFREALNSLPEIMRQVLLLRYYQGFSVDETANIIGRTYSATESLLSRARTALAKAINGPS